MLLMAAFNEIMLGVDTYLAHVLNNNIQPREWIPILFGPVAGALLLFAGIVALRRRPLASGLATAVFLVSIIVGVLGAYFHLVRGTLPTAPGWAASDACFAHLGTALFGTVCLCRDWRVGDECRLGRSANGQWPTKDTFWPYGANALQQNPRLLLFGKPGNVGGLGEQRFGSCAASLGKSLAVAAAGGRGVCYGRFRRHGSYQP